MTVNEAIYRVITTQFKKDMREAVEVVEREGYKVEKIEGGYKVRNPETRREVYISGNRYGYRRCIAYGVWNTKRINFEDHGAAFCKFDFVGNLNKELNYDWYNRREWMGFQPTREKYQKLYDVKHSIEWKKRDIEGTKKKMMELQKDLERYLRWQIEDEMRLRDLRRELKLKR